jgi:hypothetical protein
MSRSNLVSLTDFEISSANLPKLVLSDGANLKHYELPTEKVNTEDDARSWLRIEHIMQAYDQIGQKKGPGAKSSASSILTTTTSQEPTSSIEHMLVWISHHFFTSLLLTLVFVALMVSYLRYQAAHVARHGGGSQRLPLYGKVD